MGCLADSRDYARLFDHVNRLRVVVILTSPRAGSDFFQSLLDGHGQILQMPGQFQFYRFWESARCKESLRDLTREFIWNGRHVGKFDSRYEQQERWHCLGDSKSEYFQVDTAAFEHHLLSVMDGRPITSRHFFLAVHLAYGLAAGRLDPSQARLMVCHLHEPYSLPPFHRDFPGYDVVYCTRDPRNTLVSTFENVMIAYDQMDLKFYRFWLRWIVLDAEQALPYTPRTKELPLERLHCAGEQVLREFCHDFGIEFQDSLLQSTWGGKRWWGDARSKRFLGGFNPRIREPCWEGKLDRWDLLAIERLLEARMARYGYAFTAQPDGWRWRLAPCCFWLPMKYERQLARLSLRRERSLARKTLAAVECLVEYLARVRFFYNYFRRGRRGEGFVAQAYGDPVSAEGGEKASGDRVACQTLSV